MSFRAYLEKELIQTPEWRRWSPPTLASFVQVQLSQYRQEYGDPFRRSSTPPHGRDLNGIAKRRGYRRSDFNPKSLAKGRRIEMEHTRSRRLAEQIAMDHLAEDPRYYEKLLRYVEKPMRDPGYRHLSAKKRMMLSRKIRLLIHEGYPQKQAVAIAHRMLGIARPRP